MKKGGQMCEDKEDKMHELTWRLVLEQGKMVAATFFMAGAAFIGVGVSILGNNWFRWVGGSILILSGVAAVIWSIKYYRKQK